MTDCTIGEIAMNLDHIDIHSPSRYGNEGFPWADWDTLRREAPVFWYERDDIEPFWAITRHAEIMAISERPRVFINGGPRLRLALKNETELLRGGVDDFGKSRGWKSDEPPDMTFMDDPRHREVRKLSSWAFTQGCMRSFANHFDELAHGFTQQFVDALEAEGEVDIVHHLTAKLPLAATGEIIGLAPNDWKRILVWSNAIIGEVSPDQIRPGETHWQAAERSMNEFRLYLEDLIREHKQPGGGPSDFINRLVNAEIHGEQQTEQQLIGYLFLLIGAGNDTTRNATTGGVVALMEHPDQLEALCRDPALLNTAVDEILRWTSPVISFLRTATEDFQLMDKTIREGETVGMFYPSANRDESVFKDPYRFDISRDPNPYITFGFGAHFCLGTNLAKAELRSALKALIPVLPRLERAGNGHRIPNTHVSGFAELPVRLKK